MWCLWNGEYGEHDLSNIPGLSSILQTQAKSFPGYENTEVGDFIVQKVEYDWGQRDQRWTVKCKFCGNVNHVYHTRDWRRGKGKTTKCWCQKEKAKQEKMETNRQIKEQLKEQKALKEEKRQQELLNKTYGEWTITSFNSPSECRVKCTVCGREKKAWIKEVLNYTTARCHHPKDYSGPEWIGRRNGHLTAIERDGAMFVAKCDCGNEINVRPVELFTRKTKRSCGGPECQYSSTSHKEAIKRQTAGFVYEQKVAEYLSKLGHNIAITKAHGDFGVDIIITEPTGELTAVQCKMDFVPTGVSSVQEVYAGGRYYDCTRFVVFCEQGFSNPAILMAKKLGVYLCDGEYKYPDDLDKYTADLLPVFHENPGNQKLYKAYGEKRTMGDWCAKFTISETELKKWMKKGVPFERALEEAAYDVVMGISRVGSKSKQTYTIQGFTGNLSQICNHFGVIYQKVYYRMKHKGMTLEEAIFTPNRDQGDVHCFYNKT